jgi:hypothetical protein
MDLIDEKTNAELVKSLLGELAKAKNEIACARQDLEKANSRMSFLLVLTNKLIDRQKD